ncbi:MAG: hypothetical protein IKE65_09105 [Clostridia bacterium]|nr:hypothetical protein [Clostridia bacterium]
MNKKLLALCLSIVLACSIFVACKKNAEQAEQVAVIVTNENGEAVTDENGEFVTEYATPVTDENGKNITEKATNAKGEVVTDDSGNPKTVVVTQGDNKTTAAAKEEQTTLPEDYDEDIPHTTTAPINERKLDEWTFGSGTNVGCIAPNGWNNETVNQVVKVGTDIRVQMCPMNYLKNSGYKTADDYAKFFTQMTAKEEGKPKQLSYSKDVYKDGAAITMLYQYNKVTEDASGYSYGKYHMTYIFQTGDKVRIFFVFGNSEEEARTDISAVIKNTYYRG